MTRLSVAFLPMMFLDRISPEPETDTTRLDETRTRFARGGILIHRLTSIITHFTAEVKFIFHFVLKRVSHHKTKVLCFIPKGRFGKM